MNKNFQNRDDLPRILRELADDIEKGNVVANEVSVESSLIGVFRDATETTMKVTFVFTGKAEQ